MRVRKAMGRLPCLLALAWLAPRTAVASDEYVAETKPAAAYGKPVAVLLWGAAQLVPSPLLAAGDGVVQGGLRWQVTPLLYSFGIAARPWRSFIVSPIARLSGSVELFVAPEWTCCAGGSHDGFLARGGVRAYFPLIEHGESLAWSVGVSHWRHREGGISFDLGLYSLFGALGLTTTVSPGLRGRAFSLALNVRYF
ncbi:MAG: hypothetical protein EOO73_13655 [Myxococcales bacterium]|nr:MAG: hypothetical protein EOO73_13655 [Myxococcales bacterium]